MARIYLSPPHVGDDERALLLDAFDSNWIAPLGPHVDAFEREFAEATAVPHALALSSGTAALHLAMIVLGIGPGMDVLVSDLTFAATANAVAYVGARPVFVDSDLATWNMDPDLLSEELGRRARHGELPGAVIAVDLYGQCADWERIEAACSEYGVPVVEDAAEALGATCRGRAAGTFGAMGVFSFNGNKIITTSGGGMLVSHDAGAVERARYLAAQARDPVPHYEHSAVGYNYRLSNLLAALGRAQLRHLPERVVRRRGINAQYRQLLGEVAGIAFAPVAGYGEPTHWLSCIMVEPGEFGAAPDDIRVWLEQADIEARPTWKPMHRQPAFATCPVIGGSVADLIFDRGLCLPSGSSMVEGEVSEVAEAILSTPRANE
jgi:pyridoxal phosphate-dependent aminotransferase EpsN